MWCGPCKRIAPFFAKFSDQFPQITFLKVDIDECEDLANRFQISSVPAFLFFKDGKVINRLIGANEAKLESLLNDLK